MASLAKIMLPSELSQKIMPSACSTEYSVRRSFSSMPLRSVMSRAKTKLYSLPSYST